MLSPFYVIAGLIIGIVFATTAVSGPVWCIQLTHTRGSSPATGAAVGISLAYAVFCLIASLLVFAVFPQLWRHDEIARLVAASILGYMAIQTYQSSPVRQLGYDGPIERFSDALRAGFMITLTMPFRFPATGALLIALNFHLRRHALPNAFLLAFGLALGFILWHLLFINLTNRFARSIPEAVSLRSMNKLRKLSVLILLGFVFIALAPMIPGF